jgi:twitching motility two-component system response regulator PilG
MGHLVMIVDDSLTVRKILEVSLTRVGIDVITYNDGLEALNALTTGALARLPDVIILDVILPKLSGFAMARLLRSKSYLTNIPIIMLTSRSSIFSRLQGRFAGATVYLTKPFKTQDILDVVYRYLKPQDQQTSTAFHSQIR